MEETKTYLELSEDDGGSHKFYEVSVADTHVTIRYGRIGDTGQTKVNSFATPEKAQADATKKINEKVRKGYEPAVAGVRAKRAITRRQVTSTRSTAKQAPVLWRFNSGHPTFGIFINQAYCWVGNQAGHIFALDHQGQVRNQFRLANGVKCLVADDSWIYAGCDDGKVYDLGGKVPRVAYEIAQNVDIYWLDIKDGILGVSDSEGNITTINHEDESQWSQRSSGTSGWMVRCDEIGVFHGHSHGVTMYDWEDGTQIWHQKTAGSVLFGWQEEATVYAATSDNKVYCFTKKGKLEATYDCDDTVYSCASAEEGAYVFAGDSSSSIYCFDRAGTRLWKLGTGCGSALSMQFLDHKLYLVTTEGTLACMDASEEAIQQAQGGTVPVVVDIKAPKSVESLPLTAALETTTDSQGGVVLECFQEEGRLRMRVIAPGYNSDWRIQFPKEIREAGARYLVEEVRQAARGDFYRAYGTIKKLV
jgi:predicted DNA-binding WGR domain protein